MTLPLIGPDQDFALWAVLIALAGFGFWCERFPWGRKYSGVMLLITAAIVLANLKIIPTSAPTYDVVWDYLVPVAIPLLLFQADLKRIVQESGPTLLAFVMAARPSWPARLSGCHYWIWGLMKLNLPVFLRALTSAVASILPQSRKQVACRTAACSQQL